jgi:hypothetical protein
LVSGGPNTVTVYDVSTAPASISDGTATPGTTFNDLGTGVVFGSAVATTNGELLSITLSADAIDALNAARGSTIAFGLSNETVGGTPDFVFGSSVGSTPRDLVLTTTPIPAPIPTMSEWATILLGLILASAAALYIRRRQLIA